jgi:hypothetical protein
MNKICLSLFVFVAWAWCGAIARADDDSAILKKATDASEAAPAQRMTMTVTDRDSGKEIETTTMERVRPDKVHFVTKQNGEVVSEIFSDGKRTLRREGPNESWKTLPVSIGSMLTEKHQGLSEEYFREQHGHLKFSGDDRVGGIAAKVYDVTEDNGPAKVWLAADDSRILKMERDYEGPGARPRVPHGGNGQVDIKALHDQLKAMTAKRQLHSVTTFEYDPSIQINMPN